MIEPLIVKAPLNDRDFDYNHQELTTLQLLAKIIPVVNSTIAHTNSFSAELNKKENSSDITSKRKLTPNGNFTGSLNGKPVSLVVANVESNTNKIKYLANQFSNGQTGLIVDGGFFEETNIKSNYDGGIF